MAGRHVVQRYLYWSERRIRELLNDLDVQFGATRGQTRLTSPSLGGLAPTVEVSCDEPVEPTRPRIARLVEREIGDLAVTSFDSPSGFTWAKGCGSMVFGEFVVAFGEPRSQRALMYTNVRTRDGERVGICLFGSMRNYADFVVESGSPSDDGWTSSAAPDIRRFLESRCADPNGCYSNRELAVIALEIACYQGHDGPVDPDPLEGWNRGFTFGQVERAEWFAEVILDEEVSNDEGPGAGGHDRVIVGIPLWVRTASLRAVRLYIDDEIDDGVKREQGFLNRWRQRLLPPRVRREAQPCVSFRNEGSRRSVADNQGMEQQPVDDRTVKPGSRDMPWSVYRKMRAAFVAHYAEWSLRKLRLREYDPGMAVPVPDPVGTLFAWLWDVDRDEAAIMVADYMSELRIRGDVVEGGLTVSFDDFLRGLRRSIPRGVAGHAELVGYLRREVPQYYGPGLDA